MLRGFFACQLQFDFVNIGSDNLALGTNDPSQLEGNVAASAADLEAIHPGANPCSV
jgi:hypothetical protein